ncbi:MAG: response regulator transcription factor [Terracidiphilus sp.]|jgi:DNA-binding response OmpR family regulator
MRILIVEDEPRMQELLRKGLYESGFTVMSAGDGETGLEIATAHDFDALVLDIGLPRMNGHTLMQALRGRGRTTPVIILTARDSEDDIIRGLDLGADDYLTKPFSFAELVARLQSITRPHRSERDGTIEVGDVVIDPLRRTAMRDMQPIDLTRHEFLLLMCLMRQPGKCVPRQLLTQSVWGSDRAIAASTLDVLVNSLRSKIDAPFAKRLIGTVRGTGYIFRESAAAREVTQ